MKILKTTILKESRLFYPKVYEDDRGFFMESFNKYIDDELNENFIQDNHIVFYQELFPYVLL